MPMRVTYTLDGDDRSPRAYLAGLRDLISDEIETREYRLSSSTTQTDSRRLGSEVSGLTQARDLLDGVVAGICDGTTPTTPQGGADAPA